MNYIRGLILLIMIALVWLPQHVFAQCVEDDSGQMDIAGVSGSNGSIALVPVRIQNAPNQVDAFGFDLVYDTTRLHFTGNCQRGSLVQNFDFFDCNETVLGTIRVGGFEAGGDVIALGASGNVVLMEFNVVCEPGEGFPIGELRNLVDNITGWAASGGCYQCAGTTTTTTISTTSSTITTTTTTTTIITTTSTTTTTSSTTTSSTTTTRTTTTTTTTRTTTSTTTTRTTTTTTTTTTTSTSTTTSTTTTTTSTTTTTCPSLLPKICRKCPTVFRVKQGKAKCKKLKVWNCGKGTLNWTVSEGCDWLTLDPPNGTSTRKRDRITACVDTTGLEKGNNECTVTITGECATSSPQTCVIKLKVK